MRVLKRKRACFRAALFFLHKKKDGGCRLSGLIEPAVYKNQLVVKNTHRIRSSAVHRNKRNMKRVEVKSTGRPECVIIGKKLSRAETPEGFRSNFPPYSTVKNTSCSELFVFLPPGEKQGVPLRNKKPNKNQNNQNIF